MIEKKEFKIFMNLMVIVMIVLMGLLYVRLKSEGMRCMASPLVYGVRNMNKQLSTQGYCTCNTQLENCICNPLKKEFGRDYVAFIVDQNGTRPVQPLF